MKERRPQSAALNAMVTAVALMVVGAIFLLRNLDLLDLGSHWWALFLLIPLLYLGSRIVELRSRNSGKIPPAARGMLIGFLSVALVMVIFLLRLDWGDVWPLFIILAGVSFLFGRTGNGSGQGSPPTGPGRDGP